jgi:hypothetical protein
MAISDKERRLAELVLGDLPPQAAAALRAQLKSDPNAARIVRELAETAQAMRAWQKSLEALPPPAVPSPRRPRPRVVWAALAAAAAVLLAVGAWIAFGPEKTRPVDPGSSVVKKRPEPAPAMSPGGKEIQIAKTGRRPGDPAGGATPIKSGHAVGGPTGKGGATGLSVPGGEVGGGGGSGVSGTQGGRATGGTLGGAGRGGESPKGGAAPPRVPLEGAPMIGGPPISTGAPGAPPTGIEAPTSAASAPLAGGSGGYTGGPATPIRRADLLHELNWARRDAPAPVPAGMKEFKVASTGGVRGSSGSPPGGLDGGPAVKGGGGPPRFGAPPGSAHGGEPGGTRVGAPPPGAGAGSGTRTGGAVKPSAGSRDPQGGGETGGPGGAPTDREAFVRQFDFPFNLPEKLPGGWTLSRGAPAGKDRAQLIYASGAKVMSIYVAKSAGPDTDFQPIDLSGLRLTAAHRSGVLIAFEEGTWKREAWDEVVKAFIAPATK